MRHALAFGLVLAGVGAVARLGAGEGGSDWPRFRGPNADGFSPEKGLPKDWKAQPPKELWRVTLTDKGFSGPAVADGKVLIVDHEGTQDLVRALDLEKGTDLWKFPYEETLKEDYGYARCTPAVDSGKVYTLARTGLIHCLDLKTGQKVWAVNSAEVFKAKRPQWSYSMSLLVDGDCVIACPGGPEASVVALNKNTGATVWKGGGSEKSGYDTPVAATLAGKKQYVVVQHGAVLGVEAASGKLLWSHPWPTTCANTPSPMVFDSQVWVTSGYGKGCALLDVAGAEPKLVYENRLIRAEMNSPILYEGHIYCSSDPNNLVCMEAKSGVVKWTQKAIGKGGLVGVDGTLIAVDGLTGDLVMVALNPAAYQELGRLTQVLTKQKQYWAPPIVAQGKLLVRDQAVLVALALK